MYRMYAWNMMYDWMYDWYDWMYDTSKTTGTEAKHRMPTCMLSKCRVSLP